MKWSWLVILLALAGCSSAGRPDAGIPCTIDDECAIGEYCKDGWCTPFGQDGFDTCKTDSDCKNGWYCDSGVCRPGQPDAGDGADGGQDGGGDFAADQELQPNITLAGDVIIRQDSSGITYEINFGAVAVGVPMAATLLIRNSGEGELRITVLALVDDPQGEFSFSPQVPPEVILASGESSSVTINYLAKDGLTDRARLKIFSNDPDQPQIDVNLVSEFKGTARLEFSPRELDFGSVPLNQTVQKEVTLLNNGEGNAVLEISALAPEAGIAASYDYSVEAGGKTVSAPFFLNRGDDARLLITYLAQSRGRADGNFVIVSNDPASPTTLALRAEAAVPKVEVQPPTVDFGPVEKGKTAEATVIIRNIGSGPLQISGIELQAGSSPEYGLVQLPSMPATVGVGGETAFKVLYTPADLSSDTGNVVITHDAPQPGSQTILPVSGSGFEGNKPPVAKIRVNGQETNSIEAMLLDTLQLDGTQSQDDDGSIVSYLWEVFAQPEGYCGTPLSITGALSPMTSVRLTEGGLARLSLTVTDDQGAPSAPAFLDVRIGARPTAKIKTGGNDTGFVEVDLGTQLQFDGLLSVDCDGGPNPQLTYQWSIVQYPAGRGSPPAISGSGAYATVTFDFPGDYRLGLVVKDLYQLSSDPAYFDVRVRGPKALRLTLDLFNLGHNDNRVDVDFHFLKPGSTNFDSCDNCRPAKVSYENGCPNPDWGQYGRPEYRREVYEDPDGAPLPNPGNPEDEIFFQSPALGQYDVYVYFRCHSSGIVFGQYTCCDDFYPCPFRITCNEDKCDRVGDGVVSFYVTNYNNQEQLVTRKPFSFVRDTQGERIKIGTIYWPQGTLQ